MQKPKPLTVSAVVLAKVLENEAKAKELEKKFHRSMLWKWSTGRGVPDLFRAFLLQDATKGRVKARGWTEFAQAPSPTQAAA